MGETAENLVDKYKITRQEQDEFSYQTQLKYQHALQKNKFNHEIVPVRIPRRKMEDLVFDQDEHPRLSEVSVLAKLRPAFRPEGTVTAGNASGVNDGASALMLVSEDALTRYNLKPMAEVISSAAAGVHPDIMGIGPVPATKKALDRAGIGVDQLDLIELNEAFAAQAIACIRELQLDEKKINVNGGSIAIGHPLGASGARITTTLLHEMAKRDDVKYGLATMCIGVGQGVAVVFKKC